MARTKRSRRMSTAGARPSPALVLSGTDDTGTTDVSECQDWNESSDSSIVDSRANKRGWIEVPCTTRVMYLIWGELSEAEQVHAAETSVGHHIVKRTGAGAAQ